jgi:hypothetical protein
MRVGVSMAIAPALSIGNNMVTSVVTSVASTMPVSAHR